MKHLVRPKHLGILKHLVRPKVKSKCLGIMRPTGRQKDWYWLKDSKMH